MDPLVTIGSVINEIEKRGGRYLGPEIDVIQDIVFRESISNPNFSFLASKLSEVLINKSSTLMFHTAWHTIILSSLAILGGLLQKDLCTAGLSVTSGILLAVEATEWYRGYQYRSFAMDLRSEI